MRRYLPVVALLLVLTGCGSSVDTWADEQTARLTDAGVTFPPEQARNTVIAMVGACASKEAHGDDPTFMQIWIETTPRVNDWLSEADALKMYGLADEEFCANIPDGPLGEGR